MNRALLRCARYLSFVILAGAHAAAFAGSFVVTPVRIELSHSVRSAVLTVANNGDEPLVIQLRVVSWAQVGGKDTFQDSTDLLATPTVFTMGPMATQILRVALRSPSRSDSESAYRLYVEEVPTPVAGVAGIQVALRMSIPVFIAPANARSAPLQWSASLEGGKLLLTAFNSGNTSTRLIHVTVQPVDSPDQAVAALGSIGPVSLPMSYVLAGQRQDWPLPDPPADRTPAKFLHLGVTTDGGEFDAVVPVKAR